MIQKNLCIKQKLTDFKANLTVTIDETIVGRKELRRWEEAFLLWCSGNKSD